MAAYPGCWEETPDRDFKNCNFCRQEKRLPPIHANMWCDHHTKIQELEARRQLFGSGIVHATTNQRPAQRAPSEPLRYKSARALT